MIEKVFGVAMCLLAFLPAILDHGKRRAEWKAAAPGTKWNAGLQYFVINWGLPLGGAIGLVLNFMGTAESAREIEGLHSDVAVLSNELGDARTRLRDTESKTASLDPMKQPIVTMTARLRFFVAGGFIDDHKNHTSCLCFEPTPSAGPRFCKILLYSEKARQGLVYEDGKVFDSYNIDFVRSPDVILEGIATGESVESVDDLRQVTVDVPFLTPNAEVLNGELTVTINSVMVRKFPVPWQTRRNGVDVWDPISNRVNVLVRCATIELEGGKKVTSLMAPSRTVVKR